jgi:polysaccharide biosynthesis protein PslH
MRVLFFTYDFPYPTNSGGKMRAYNMMKYAKAGNDITLFSFVRDTYLNEYMTKMKEIGITSVETFPRKPVKSLRNLSVPFRNHSLFRQLYYDNSVADRLYREVRDSKIDIVHYESFYPGCYLSEKIRGLGAKQIYGSENIEYKLYEDYVSRNTPALLKPFLSPQIRKIKAEELHLVRNADMTLTVTESEKAFFSTFTKKPIHVIENGVEVDEFSNKIRRRTKKFTVLFVGNFSYFPNKTAVEFFYTQVMKKIADDSLLFKIVGKGASQFQSFADPRIETIEFMDDIKDAYYSADIFVCPIAIGGGTNFKILEAMATGLPVVAFTDRVTEIGAKHDRDVLTADTGEEFLAAVQKLITNAKLAEHLAKNARKIIEEKYAWDAIGKRLQKAWTEVYENG